MQQASIMMTFLVMAMGAAWLALYQGALETPTPEAAAGYAADYVADAVIDAALAGVGT